jgi:hypothetical protein
MITLARGVIYSWPRAELGTVVVSSVVTVRVSVSTVELKVGIVNLRVAELTPGKPKILFLVLAPS